MPLFNFQCPQCSLVTQRLVKASQSITVICECGTEAEKQLPDSLNTQTLEMRDAHRGVQLPKNHERKIKDRMTRHHDKYEVAQKIDEHGLEDAQRSGWLKKAKESK